MKQSAVNWLIEQMQKGELQSFRKGNKWTITQTSGNDILEQAREMEKEQIMESWAAGEYPSAESYYQDTYQHHDPSDDEIYNNFNHEGGIKFTKDEWQGR